MEKTEPKSERMPESFHFLTSIQAIGLTGLQAQTLAELYQGLEQVDGSSIYHHTYRFLRSLHFLPDTPRSDFASWLSEKLREEELAEQIAVLDLRAYPTLRDLRQALLAIIGRARNDPRRWTRTAPPGMEFHFGRSTSIVLSTGYEAAGQPELVHALERVDVGSLFFHLVEAPLHQTSPSPWNNDFSAWLDGQLQLGAEAKAIAALDVYQLDLETIRERMIAILGGKKWQRAFRRALDRPGPSSLSPLVRGWLRRFKSNP
ncbi:MAG: DUF5752 family protein [candidate division FCPU426 bacterium]